MSPGSLLALFAAGAGAGFLGSMLGVGGGIFLVPILVIAAGIPIHLAIGTSLVCVIATSSATASRYIEKGLVNVRLGVLLELFTVVGALAGSWIAGLLSGQALTMLFAGALIVMAIPMAGSEPPASAIGSPHAAGSWLARLDGVYHDEALGTMVRYGLRRVRTAIGSAGVAGISSGLLGIGGGTVLVPIMTLLNGIPVKAAVATSNFMIGVTAAASATVYYARGDVIPLVAAVTVLGVFAGSKAGSRLTPRVQPYVLRRVFAAVMVAIAVRLLWETWW